MPAVPGAVTIATNMAGRGTDIQLGGNLQMRIQREMAQMTDEAERAKRIEAIKAEIAAKREEVLKLARSCGDRAGKNGKPDKTDFPGGLSSSAPSATRAGASTTSFAAGRAARAILRALLSSRSKTT